MVAMEAQDETRAASVASATGLQGVKSVVLCASCKGGVGKSTTAVNLDYSLHAQGHKVGILDVDIYGPSLPTMVTPTRPFNPAEDIVGNAITPVDGDGVKLMSMGYINPVDSFVLRGAKVTPLVQQLISTTQWGDLDYLIIDMPPGTGDIHLTLAQMDGLRIDAAVIVTTPQRLSFVDVVKGVEMFDKVGIPSVAVVENLAYLEPGATTEAAGQSEAVAAFAKKYALPTEAMQELEQLVLGKQYVFGQGHRQRLLDMWGIVNSFSVPIDPTVARQGDSGVPFVKAFPASPAAKVYSQLAEAVVGEVTKLKEQADTTPELVFDPSTQEFVINGSQRISAVDLRRLCRSPANNPDAVPPSVAPMDWMPLGRYAVSIRWNDGHQSLMPYRAFVDGYD
jgi:Mrp family chromosome partitioning ATPase